MPVSKRTPLYDTHRALGARMIEFGGWEMPVQYSGILAEHQTVRTKAGLFDLSHMGEIEIRGPRALEVCQELLVTDVARIQLGQAQYSILCYPDGGVVDDIIVYYLADQHYFLCVNASNIEKDFAWLTEHNRGRATMVNCSDEYALIAVQGPRASAIVQRLTTLDLGQLRRYWSVSGEVGGVSALVARTGYTGEDGFELFVAARHAAEVWNACLEAEHADGGGADGGRADGIAPIGLGARDTLRLEAGYLLYGNDMDAQTTPLEAGVQRLVKFDKGPFVGRDALLQQQTAGIPKQLIGLVMDAPGIPRHGYELHADGQLIGVVTSGTQSPSLGVGIAMGYVPPEHAKEGASLAVNIRGRHVPAHVTARPFYRRE
jgi:aminomethyltransferase